VPLAGFDAGYDAVASQQGLADRRAALLVRLRAGRCFYADPAPAPPRPKGGRPFRHGHEWGCADPATRPAPTDERMGEATQYGRVRVRAGAGLRPARQDRTGRGTKGPTPIVRMTLILVEVGRLPRPTRTPTVLWLWWHAPVGHPLDRRA
jgi:hypothetical protein